MIQEEKIRDQQIKSTRVACDHTRPQDSGGGEVWKGNERKREKETVGVKKKKKNDRFDRK